MDKNIYKPYLAELREIKRETPDVKTFKVEILEDIDFNYLPGQFAMVSVFGRGECPISFSSSNFRDDLIEFSVKRLGKVTVALHELEAGDRIGVRGPYGNGFPIDDWKGKNLVFIGGGIGQAPLRSSIRHVLAERESFDRIDIFYGAPSTEEIVFEDELYQLEDRNDLNVYLSIDEKEGGWSRFVGFVPENVERIAPSSENSIALTCGPPVMIKFVVKNLKELGFESDEIFTSLEMKMKCGVGKCGRCNVGSLYVCKDGPVFSYDQVQESPLSIEEI
ncbi:hypothetical protein AKJ64_04535 [candidate division MSBL1 archaeon SCGC-AAA259E17]|uniref:FAD-binding FR-type domain-containing protein n=1 Tax=candidate division MSBL1 archaeon SCGC-AAA259E17 TaxID=1698263 RepID=A0A133UC53_9EURY|nr:hypothetical protein AKJ64_04535 [candidate division MSBL1 archaeon SCGC-AAA259E17]